MSSLDASVIAEIISRRSITDFDVARLRRAFYEDGIIGLAEAEQMFEANDACTVKDASWPAFFIEAICDFLINQTEPDGYLTAANADWLIQHVSKNGYVETETELELLVTILEKARWSPVRLIRYALAQVKRAVIEDQGPLRAGAGEEKGQITSAEIDLLKRMLYAFAGDGNIAVTRDEAEILFEINDALFDGAVTPEWTDFFTKALANVLMATSGYAVPAREVALRREAWLETRGDLGPGAMLQKMAMSSLSAIMSAYKEQSTEEQAIAQLERQRVEIITNEQISKDEAEWLADRLCRDGRLSSAEKALIAFLKRECPSIHPALKERLSQISEAA